MPLCIRNNENRKESVYEILGRFGEVIGIFPPFDFKTKTLNTSNYTKLKVFIISFGILLSNIFSVWDSPRWQHPYKIHLFTRFSTYISIIMTLATLFGSLTRQNIWEEFFIECIKLHENTNLETSGIAAHFSKKIKYYLGLYLIVNITIPLSNYIIWIKYIDCVSAIGSATLIFNFKSQKFIVFGFLNDLKLRYSCLNSLILTLKSENNRQAVLDIINDLEVNTLRIFKVTCLFKKLFGYHFLIIMTSGFLVGIEYCLYTYVFRLWTMTSVFVFLVVSNHLFNILKLF